MRNTCLLVFVLVMPCCVAKDDSQNRAPNNLSQDVSVSVPIRRKPLPMIDEVYEDWDTQSVGPVIERLRLFAANIRRTKTITLIGNSNGSKWDGSQSEYDDAQFVSDVRWAFSGRLSATLYQQFAKSNIDLLLHLDNGESVLLRHHGEYWYALFDDGQQLGIFITTEMRDVFEPYWKKHIAKFS